MLKTRIFTRKFILPSVHKFHLDAMICWNAAHGIHSVKQHVAATYLATVSASANLAIILIDLVSTANFIKLSGFHCIFVSEILTYRKY